MSTAKRYAKGAAVVAGGSGGLGAVICAELAANGADVAILYRSSPDKANAVAEKVRASGRKASVHQADLRDVEAVKAVAAAVVEQYGGIHTTVYAAGPHLPIKYFSQLDPKVVADTMTTDILGCYHLIHATLPGLREAKGVLVALGSAAIRRYAKTDVLSASPKAAIEVLVRSVAAEEGRFGVRANTIGVGLFEEGITHTLLAEGGGFDQRFMAASKTNIALQRMGRAPELAPVVAFLASDAASYITGQLIMVDGGYAI